MIDVQGSGADLLLDVGSDFLELVYVVQIHIQLYPKEEISWCYETQIKVQVHGTESPSDQRYTALSEIDSLVFSGNLPRSS